MPAYFSLKNKVSSIVALACMSIIFLLPFLPDVFISFWFGFWAITTIIQGLLHAQNLLRVMLEGANHC